MNIRNCCTGSSLCSLPEASSKRQEVGAQVKKLPTVEAKMMARMMQHIMIMIFFCSVRRKTDSSISRYAHPKWGSGGEGGRAYL